MASFDAVNFSRSTTELFNTLNSYCISFKSFISMDVEVSTDSFKFDILSFSNLDQCLEFVDEDPDVESIFVIGGERLYREAINNKLCKYVYLNKIDGTYECDTFFPELGNDFKLKSYNELSGKVVSYIYEKLK